MCEAIHLTTCCSWNILFAGGFSDCTVKGGDSGQNASEVSHIETVNRRPLVANPSLNGLQDQHESEYRGTIYLLSERVMPFD
jgi:hypothetical protein